MHRTKLAASAAALGLLWSGLTCGAPSEESSSPAIEAFKPWANLDPAKTVPCCGWVAARGRIKACDAKSGKLRWVFYTPGPGEPGHDTWPADNDAWQHGGATIWQTLGRGAMPAFRGVLSPIELRDVAGYITGQLVK